MRVKILDGVNNRITDDAKTCNYYHNYVKVRYVRILLPIKLASTSFLYDVTKSS